MKTKYQPPVRLSHLSSSPEWRLDQLLEYLPLLQRTYGKQAVLRVDVGAGDAVVEVLPTKKARSRR